VPTRADKTETTHAHRLRHRTSQLHIWSRILYKIEHYTFLPSVALAVTVALVALVVVIGVLGFSRDWVAAFEMVVASATLVMVFAIQHTQGREQAATQRKLDELIRAMPGADESLMMLEEASQRHILNVEDEQRDIRSKSPDSEPQ
jgi:low affinity Fe/Cu permease